jgi:Cu-Zn family superoxide dismutase
VGLEEVKWAAMAKDTLSLLSCSRADTKGETPMRRPVRNISTALMVSAGCLSLLGYASVKIGEQTLAQQPARRGAAMQTNTAMQEHDHAAPAALSVSKAIAVIHPLGNSNVKGTVTFTKMANGVQINAEITGLTPGEHGFHIHEWGDCSSADGMSTGGHYNPTGAPHAGPDSRQRHVGDFGNVTADQTGKATLNRVDNLLAFEGPTSIVGRAVVVHAGRDDLRSQPSGDAGGRIGCGVIGIANPAAQ